MDRLFWYIVTVVVAGIVSVWMPPYIIVWLNPYVGGLAATIANVANIVAQVVINYTNDEICNYEKIGEFFGKTSKYCCSLLQCRRLC